MKYYKSLMIIVVLLILCSITVHAELYDGFSSGSLDTSKWIEQDTFEHLSFLAEHYVDTTEQKYHQAQPTVVGDRETRLTSTRSFAAGETIEYDVYYNSGSGNILSRIWVNDKPADRWFVDDGLPADQNCPGKATCGDIGYWNGASSDGNNVIGKYHVKLFFNHDNVNIKITDPDGNLYSYPSPTNIFSEPYTFSVSSRTGDNGIAHFDYDNFVINDVTQVPEFEVITGVIAIIGLLSGIYIMKSGGRKL